MAQFLKLEGVNLAYAESGAGEALLLLHGINSDRHQFDVFRPLLRDGIRAIALDQRDSPDSPYDRGAYSTADHADDVAAAINALGLAQAHVMGTSYGGAVAMTFAIRHPKMAKSLILGATAPSIGKFRSAEMIKAREQGEEALARFMLETVIPPDAGGSAALIAETQASLRIRPPESLARRMEAAARHDVEDRLGDINAPTLVLQGDEDPLIAVGTGEEMAAKIPGARFELLAGSRHGITFQNREKTARLVREFVLANA